MRLFNITFLVLLNCPYRSSKEELLSIAEELETQYQAKICAGFIREAAEHYERRKKLKGDN